VFVGCFIEEVISPIPSFVVLIPAGAAALVQGHSWWYLPVLALIGGVGRILASMLLYVIADKAKDWLFSSGRRFFGVTHKQLEDFGKRFSGSRRDWWLLFSLNAIPVLPTAVLSLACGFVRIDFRLFVTATYLGSLINSVFYMSIGYAGVQVADSLRHAEIASQIVVWVLVVAAVVWLFYYRAKRKSR
jgi:membrane protein DedA with SNARE-associated domain